MALVSYISFDCIAKVSCRLSFIVIAMLSTIWNAKTLILPSRSPTNETRADTKDSLPESQRNSNSPQSPSGSPTNVTGAATKDSLPESHGNSNSPQLPSGSPTNETGAATKHSLPESHSNSHSPQSPSA
jgi:hypothetical protein